MEVSEICISKVLCFIWSTSHWEGIIDSQRTPSSSNRTFIDSSIDAADLQTATVDVNHIHKARYSVQLSVVSIHTCLKKAHKVSNFVLPLFSWAEERSSSSRMLKYWMLLMKFQINYLVFIRFMRVGNFKLFVKILISLVKWFLIFNHYNYARWLSVKFKICWVYPSHALNFIKNLKEEILLSRFQVESFHEFFMTKVTNKATRQLSLSKGQSILWIMKATSYREGRRSQDPKLPNILSKWRAKYPKVPTKMTLITMMIILHTMLSLGKITLA